MSVITHFLHLPHFHTASTSDKTLWRIYAVDFLLQTAMRIGTFYLPIFLYQLGAANLYFNKLGVLLTPTQSGLITAALFYLVSRLIVIVIITTVARSRWVQKLHAYFFIQMGLLSLMLVMLSLVLRQHSVLWFLVASILMAIFLISCKIGFSHFLDEYDLKTHFTESLGIVQAFSQTLFLLTPMLAGVMITTVGFEVVMLFSVILLAVSLLLALTLNGSAKTQTSINFQVGDLTKLCGDIDFRQLCFAEVGRYFHHASLLLWPLFLFLLLGRTDRVGYIYGFSFVIALTCSFLLGISFNHVTDKKMFFISGWLVSILTLLRSLPVSIWILALIDAADKVLGNFHWLYHDLMRLHDSKRLSQKSRQSQELATEWVVSYGAVFFWLVVIVASLVLSNPWAVYFVMAAAAVVLGLCVRVFVRSEKSI